jgi:signal transduction histidine kinase
MKASAAHDGIFPALRSLFARDASPLPLRAAFDAFARARTIDTARAVVLFIVLAAFLWWPVDYFPNRDDPLTLRVTLAWRVCILILGVLTFAALSFWRFARAHVFTVVTVSSMAHAAALAGFLAPLGGIEEPWFHSALLVPPCTLAFLTPIGARIGIVLLTTAASLGAFFGVAPEHLAHPRAFTALGMVFFASVSSVLVGHVIYVLTRRNFHQARSLEERNVGLERDNESLAERLAEQLDEVRRLASHMETTREEERRRIAHELHDELGQSLTAMRYDVDRSRKFLHKDPAKAEEALDRLSQAVDAQMTCVRRIVSEMRPQVLDDLGLVAAIEWLTRSLAEQTGLEIRFRAEPADIDVEHAAATALYRVAQEALNNALKHSGALSIGVTLRADGDGLMLRVCDDGAGLNPTHAAATDRDRAPAGAASGHNAGSSASLGIVGMRERLRVLGGRVQISDMRPGVCIEAFVPARTHDAAPTNGQERPREGSA